MIELAYLFFVVLLAFALGKRILRIMGIKFENNPETLIFSLPLGFVILAYVTFLFGILGLLYKSALISILAVFSILLIKDIKNTVLLLLKSINKLNLASFMKKYQSGLGFYHVLTIFISLFIILNFIASLAPPWHFDVIAYHLAIQKIYIRAHQIIYLPYLFFSNLPSLVDTIYLAGLLLYNGVLSNLFGYTLAIVSVLAVYSFCKRFFNQKIAVLASLIFYSFPMVLMLSKTSHVDVQFALFIFLSFYALFVFFGSQDIKWLVLCAIFAGFGISSKIFGAVGAFGIFALLISNLAGRLRKSKISYRNAFYKISVFCIIVLVVVLPWPLKNYFYTGNPVWPAMNDFFHGKYWDEKHQEDLSNMINSRKISLVNYIRLPWDIHTQMGKDIDDDLGLGPFFLTFLPLYFIMQKRNKIINLFFVLLLIYITIWFFLSTYIRYIIFSWPLIAIISAYVIAELLKNRHVSTILKILLIFTFSFNLFLWVGANAKQIPVAMGFESTDGFYLKYPGPIYKASKFVNENLPENSKILLFRDTRGFFLDRDYVWGDPLFQLYINYSKFNNENDFYKELKRLGISHILVNNQFEWHGAIVNDYRYNNRILKITDNLLEKYTTNVYNSDGITINELKNEQ